MFPFNFFWGFGRPSLNFWGVRTPDTYDTYNGCATGQRYGHGIGYRTFQACYIIQIVTDDEVIIISPKFGIFPEA